MKASQLAYQSMGGSGYAGVRGLHTESCQRSTRSCSPARTSGYWCTPRGYDASKQLTGRKRCLVVAPLGLLLAVAVHATDL